MKYRICDNEKLSKGTKIPSHPVHCKIRPTKRKGWNIPPFMNSTINGYDCVKQTKGKTVQSY